MVKINKPWNRKGDFLTYYTGSNKVIHNSSNRITFQNIKLKEDLRINQGEEKRCCFEMTLLNRNFLMVLDGEEIYEITKEDDQIIYTSMTESWMYMSMHKQEGKNYIAQGGLNLKWHYNEMAEFQEVFEYQIVFSNIEPIRNLFEGINEN